jgi:hypothetical protein
MVGFFTPWAIFFLIVWLGLEYFQPVHNVKLGDIIIPILLFLFVIIVHAVSVVKGAFNDPLRLVLYPTKMEMLYMMSNRTIEYKDLVYIRVAYRPRIYGLMKPLLGRFLVGTLTRVIFVAVTERNEYVIWTDTVFSKRHSQLKAHLSTIFEASKIIDKT